MLIAGTLVGCGGDDKADPKADSTPTSEASTPTGEATDEATETPTETATEPAAGSEQEFCDAFEEITTATSDIDENDTQGQIAAAKDAVETLSEVDTPEGMPEDAQAGLELLVDTILGVDDNASQAELDAINNDFTKKEQDSFLAFVTYVGQTLASAALPHRLRHHGTRQ